MNQPVDKKKIEDLKKKISRLEKDYDKVFKNFEAQKEKVEKKKSEIEKAKSELVSALLISNDMTISNLVDMLTKTEDTSSNKQAFSDTTTY